MHTIAAIATPHAVGGISVVRLSGDDAILIADKIFKTISKQLLSTHKGYTAAFGKIVDCDGVVDEGVALVFRAPKSYTGENVVEISCHGGLFVSRKVLRAALQAGATMAQNGEFTKRAFLNKKMSLTQAESVVDMINAQSDQAAKSAVSTMEGALYREIESVCNSLVTVAGHLSAWVDYPEEDIAELEQDELRNTLQSAQDKMTHLLSNYDTGKIMREGVETAIVGKPNVGKSTLMNLLAGFQKSIVTEIAGTTRDVVEESVDIGGIVLRLADTAGIRETEDVVEQIGVDRARKRIQTSAVVIALFDSSEEITSQDELLIQQLDAIPVVAVVNKTDLSTKIDIEYIQSKFKQTVFISTKTTDGIEKLKQAIFDLLALKNIDGNAPMLSNERQRVCAVSAQGYIKESMEALNAGFTLDAVTVSIESAIESLLALTGERVTDTIVDEVFSHFCVGK